MTQQKKGTFHESVAETLQKWEDRLANLLIELSMPQVAGTWKPIGTGNPSLLGVTLAGAPVLEVGRTNLRMLGASVFQKFWVLCYYVTMWHNMCLSFPNRTPKEINISQKFKTNKVVFPLMFIQCRRNDLKAFETHSWGYPSAHQVRKKWAHLVTFIITSTALLHDLFIGVCQLLQGQNKLYTLAKKLPKGMKMC